MRSDSYVQKMKGNSKRIEVLCNEFAGEFLVPTEDIKLLLHNHTIDNNLLVGLAKKYSVSREVILRKCLNLNLITSESYKAKVNEWAEERYTRKKPGSGGNYYLTMGAYLGKNYIDVAFSRYYQKKISIDQLASYLRVKVKSVPGMESQLLRRVGAK